MIITIANDDFFFDNKSTIRTESNGYDLYIEEPDFDKTTEENIGHFTSKEIVLPNYIERRVNRNSTELPCSKVFQDAKGRKRLYTYFD